MEGKKISASQVVSEFLRQKGISKSSLAKKLGESPSNLSQKLDRGDLDTGYLLRISEALDHNFFEDLSRLYKKKGNDAPAPDSLTEAITVIKDLVKQNNALMEEAKRGKGYAATIPHAASLSQFNEPSLSPKTKSK